MCIINVHVHNLVHQKFNTLFMIIVIIIDKWKIT